MTAEHQAAGGVAVEAMGERGRARQAEAQRVEMILEIVAALGAAMHGQTRRLVDDEHQPVSIEQAREEIIGSHGANVSGKPGRVEWRRLVPARGALAREAGREARRREIMADDQVDRIMSRNAYIFGGFGAVLGGVMGAAVVGFPSAIGAVIIGALAGGVLGSFIAK
jgi:hypothetical protein